MSRVMRTVAGVFRCLLVVHISVLVSTVGGASLSSSPTEEIAEAASYLTRYGYSSMTAIDDRKGALTSLSNSIAEFQRFAALQITGELDEATLAKMREPRCGVKDKIGPSYKARRRRRYALQGSRWRTRDIKYKILSWPSRLSSNKEEVRKAITQSFEVWADVSSLKFREVEATEKAQIEIRFASGDHGDGDPFDGRGGTLAHAFFPLYGGDAHFDDSERWSVGGRFGTDIFMTASHEFGHSLGLSHSDDSSSLMAPFYKSPPSNYKEVLKEDDILGIQALYGPNEEATGDAPAKTPSVATEETTEDEDPTLCSDASVDAMFTAGSQQQTYVFKGSRYWRLTKEGIENGYPRQIRGNWDGVPNNIDAAFSWPTVDRIYFFKDDQYWRMTGFKMDRGYPKQIAEGFPGIPDNLDAVFRWIGNGRLYFFKGSQYWKFDTSREEGPVPDSYPQPIANWDGIANDIDTVLTYSNNRTYFFKKGFYYRFNDAKFKVDYGEPPYPRPAGFWWFGCKSQSNGLQSASQRGDMSPEDDFSDAVIGFGDVNVQARRAGRGGNGSQRTPGSAGITGALAALTLLLPAALRLLHL